MTLACLCGGLELVVFWLVAGVALVAAYVRRLWRRMRGQPVPLVLPCPRCALAHIDRGLWATRPHKTHLCEKCGHTWRPYAYPTVGVSSAGKCCE